jgi:hypothetical protein
VPARAGDNALTVSWPPVVNQVGYDTVLRYSITVDPIDVPRVPDLVVRAGGSPARGGGA